MSKGDLPLGRHLDKELVVTDDAKEDPVAKQAVFPEHALRPDVPRLLQLFGHIVHKILMGCHGCAAPFPVCAKRPPEADLHNIIA